MTVELESIEGIQLPSVDELVHEMLTAVQAPPTFKNMDLDNWKVVHQETSPVSISVYQNQERFKTLVELAYPIEEVVEFCTNVLNRPTWDDFCVEAKILHNIDENTQIHYTCSRRLLTVSGRDLVNIFHRRQLDDGNRWVTCARSIIVPAVPPYSGKVRADARLIGILFERHPTNPQHCRLMQISDLDSKMSLPSFFLSYLAGKAIPGGIRNLNKAISKAIESKEEEKAE